MSCAHARLILLRRQRFWHASTADPGLTLEWPAFGSARSCYFSAPGARPPSLTRALGSRALRLASRPLPSTTRGRAVARPQRLEAAGRGAQHEEKRGARHVCLRESGRLPGCGASVSCRPEAAVCSSPCTGWRFTAAVWWQCQMIVTCERGGTSVIAIWQTSRRRQ